MIDVVYLLGAGASYGTRLKDESGNIKEFSTGLPIVKEIGQAVNLLCKRLTSNIYSSKIEQSCTTPLLIEELEWLQAHCNKYKTIDTFAKELADNYQHETLSRLKRALSFFFCLSQSPEKCDERYEMLWQEIAPYQRKLPDNCCILSWNYDNQVEFTMHKHESERTSDTHLIKYGSISDKTITSNFIDASTSNFIKINGSATFKDSRGNQPIDFEDYCPQMFEKWLNENETRWVSGISYSWEEDRKFLAKVKSLISSAKKLVVIGYSFPESNTIVDCEILSAMPYLKEVYIQDKSPKKIVDNLDAILKTKNYNHRTSLNCSVISIENVERFYIPQELKTNR